MDYSNNKSTSSTQQLLICFTSSSSIKMSSSRSSILSPGRAGSTRDQQPTTLTTSLSRRLKHSRSIKGGASPAMFPTAGKKRGCGFDNPEPSSPKVTCIGQVRVKSKKKHAKNVNSLSSLRKFDHSRSQRQHLENNGINGNNQKWVHIPLTICEALRTFGSEVSCLFPCRSSCSSNTGLEKEEKVDDGGVDRQGSCSAVVARWLVALQEGDGGGGDRREMELVGGDDVDDGNVRRHVFQDLEIVDDSIMGSMDEGRVSICVPPKNALLLMRCRSDPLMMEALANRFWEPSCDRNDKEDEEFVDGEEEIEENKVCEEDVWVETEKKVMALGEIIDQECEVSEEIVEINEEMEVQQSVQEENVEMNLEIEKKESVLEKNDQEQGIESNEDEESFYLEFLFEENEEQELEKEEEEEDDMEDAQEELYEDVQEFETGESNIEKVKLFEEENQYIVTEVMSENEAHEEIVMRSEKVDQNEVEKENQKKDTNTSKPLPECLLLMMYEPKLSMEVSKETWVCSSDFIRRKSNRKKPPQPPPQPTQPQVKSIEGQDESTVNASSSPSGVTIKEHDNHFMRISAVQDEPGLHQPARSSHSFPTRPLMAAVLEQKLVNTMGYEPLVLTRCKSEPMRTAAAKLKPDTCYWKNKLEPPRRASFGIGMAGLGF